MRKEFERILFLMYSRTQNSILRVFEQLFGEVPKLAEGTPLERVQVVNSGARVQIPPSPLIGCRFITYCRMETERQKKDKKVLTKHERHDKMYIALLMTE